MSTATAEFCEDSAANAPRYDTTAPSAIRAIGDRASETRGSSSSHGASRGSVFTEQAPNKPTFLIATVTENRAREIGICAIDLASPYELLLWNIVDSHSYVETVSLLQAFQPIEILVVDTGKPQRINDEIIKRFSKSICRVVPIARRYFDQTKGAEDLKRVMFNRVDINIGRNYVIMAAVSCMMHYVEYIQGVYIAEKTMKVVLNPSTQKLLMDYATISSLELFQTTRGDSVGQSLCSMMNNTQTSVGYRLLRSTMLQPTCHLKTIQNRHELIEIFLENPGWFFDVMEQLANFVDLDRLLAQLVVIPKVITPRISRASIGNVIALKQTLECLPNLASCLEAAVSKFDKPCALLSSVIRSLRHDDFDRITRKIERVINERVKVSRSAAQKRIQECFAVRAGIDGMLDVARRTYLDSIEKIHDIAHSYKENLDIPVRLNYTARRGYHLILPSNATNLPSSLIQRIVTKKAICCSTKELKSLNTRLQEALVAVYKLSNGVIQELLNKVRPLAPTMYSMVESVAVLDMILSFTNVVALSPAEQPYVKPNVSEHGNMVIKNGRHPLVERVMKDQAYVANDTFFDPLSTFHIVTGPNCGGKSTYMRSVAIITILAQMGCYVPATEAFIPIRDRICTRFGTSDDMEENASTFAVEMTETAFILETCTPKSLIFIDELGRGTTNDEGAAIAWSISEELIQKRAYTCFATHYHELNRLADLYSHCRCYHMSASSGEHHIRFQYKLKDGPFLNFDMYGIKTAKICRFPLEIIKEAETIYSRLMRDQNVMMNDANEDSASSKLIVNRRLLHHLFALRYSDLDPRVLRRQLQHLREKFVIPIQK